MTQYLGHKKIDNTMLYVQLESTTKCNMKCRTCIRSTGENFDMRARLAAATSALSFNEIFWTVKKHRDFNKALKATKPPFSAQKPCKHWHI